MPRWKWIVTLGEAMGRTASESSSAAASLLPWKRRFAFLVSLALFGFFIALFTFQAREWATTKLDVILPWNLWHTAFAPTSEMDALQLRPTTESILASHTTKADSENAKRVQARAHEPFWIAAEIPVASMLAASNTHSTVLSLGYVSSEFRLWIDEELVLTGTDKAAQAVFVPISEERLQNGKPMTVVFEMKNTAGWTYPDMLELFFKGPGFLTGEAATRHVKEMDFMTATRPSMLLTLYLVMAIAFLFFWLSAPRRQEYFMMAVYCIVLSALQAHLTTYGQNSMSPMSGFRVDVFIYCWEASISLAIAFSFARTRRLYSRIANGVFTVVPLIVVLAYQDRTSLLKASSMIQLYLAPPLLVIGALACFIQAGYLSLNLQISAKTKALRVQRLSIFGIGLLIIAAVHVVQSNGSISDSFRFWCMAHFGMVMFLAVLVVSDYQETESAMGRVPFSRFHTPECLNVPVTGALVTLDLKRSETLLTEGARLGDSSALVKETISLMRHTLTSFGGTLILTDGDSIKCFFNDTRNSGMENAFRALTHVQDQLKALTRTMQTEHRLPSDYEISFRAGLVTGTIRPTLETLAGKDYPEWQQVGQGQPFLESARLMEAETRLALTDDSCILILKDQEIVTPGWSPYAVTVKFKHGQIVEVVAFRQSVELRAVA